MNAMSDVQELARRFNEDEAVWRSRSHFVTLKRGQNLKYQPRAFAEHGAIMAATALHEPT